MNILPGLGALWLPTNAWDCFSLLGFRHGVVKEGAEAVYSLITNFCQFGGCRHCACGQTYGVSRPRCTSELRLENLFPPYTDEYVPIYFALRIVEAG